MWYKHILNCNATIHKKKKKYFICKSMSRLKILILFICCTSGDRSKCYIIDLPRTKTYSNKTNSPYKYFTLLINRLGLRSFDRLSMVEIKMSTGRNTLYTSSSTILYNLSAVRFSCCFGLYPKWILEFGFIYTMFYPSLICSSSQNVNTESTTTSADVTASISSSNKC